MSKVASASVFTPPLEAVTPSSASARKEASVTVLPTVEKMRVDVISVLRPSSGRCVIEHVRGLS